MRLAELIRPEGIRLRLAAGDLGGALAELAQTAAAVSAEVDPARAVAALRARERLGSTAVGDGVVLPHARVPGLSRLVAVLGIAPAGLDVGAPDGRPGQLFVALLTPEGPQTAHLDALAAVSRTLREAGLRRALLEAPTAEAAHRLLAEADAAVRTRPSSP